MSESLEMCWIDNLIKLCLRNSNEVYYKEVCHISLSIYRHIIFSLIYRKCLILFK